MKNIASAFLLTGLVACGGGSAAPTPAPAPAPTPAAPAPAPTPAPAAARVESITADRAVWLPSQPVVLQLRLSSVNAFKGRLRLQPWHLGDKLTEPAAQDVQLQAATPQTVTVTWQPPATDFRGYRLELTLEDEAGAVQQVAHTAVDVSSSWLKFPRYGYLTDYREGLDTQPIIEQLKGLHLNALQYYDWQWKHHQPLKREADGSLAASWPEIAGRPVSQATLRKWLSGARAAGMVSMQYNLIYGAVKGYEADGVDPRWGLFETPGGKLWQLDMPGGWQTPAIWMFNPLNTGWQKYILDRTNAVFAALPFDGWHADTIGDWGMRYDADGKPVAIQDTFAPFLNAAKDALGSKYLVMNVVGNKGHAQVNRSMVDGIYAEIWPGDGIVDYATLKATVDESRLESGGKSLMVPAYMNYDYSKKFSSSTPGKFNAPGVILTAATVFAAGGSRLELGDDLRMLSSEYFPNRNLAMDSALNDQIHSYYRFLVAYENLLRDGQENSNLGFTLTGATLSHDGRAGTVWAWGKADAKRDIVQLINLQGVKHTQWRDSDATQAKPTRADNLEVTLRPTKRIARAWAASPDLEDGRPQALTITEGDDAQGHFVRVKLPKLDYWQMLVLERAE